MSCLATYFKHIFECTVPSYINGTTCKNNYHGLCNAGMGYLATRQNHSSPNVVTKRLAKQQMWIVQVHVSLLQFTELD